ncbi:two-component system response regulator BtsR [Colwellia sp. KU-HH00111]|uniref:LytR/AlgR family response regulator transcription factor n=1 Tax=Colwellia sp. KU-HH00111 TaxID=3127652 RepID=UPI0031064F66
MKAIVIEDSRLAREGLARMLGAFAEINVLGLAANVSDALLLIQQHTPDVLFLDIHMPEENAFDLLSQLNYQPKIIFTTAYSEYAVQSFEYNTIDYLLKPISQSRLGRAIEKLSQANHIDDVVTEPPLTMDSRILVKEGENCQLVPLKSIDLIESCKNYVRLFWQEDATKLSQKAFIKKSLNQIEERLPSNEFFRTNRQFIINLQSILKIEENITDGFDILLNNGRLIEVSRRNAVKLKALLSL